MEYIRIARAIGGLAAILTLLGLLTLEVMQPSVVVEWPRLILIVALISALLGIDIMSKIND